MTQTEIITIAITSESDLISVRKAVRNTSEGIGFGITDITRIVTATSELARNIYRYAGNGHLSIHVIDTGMEAGIELVFEDDGPGIPDIDQAMEVGYTSGNGLGMGLPGAKRLMDEMEIDSEIGKGTRVVIRKWFRG